MEGIQPSYSRERLRNAEQTGQQTDTCDKISQQMIAALVQAVREPIALIPHLKQRTVEEAVSRIKGQAVAQQCNDRILEPQQHHEGLLRGLNERNENLENELNVLRQQCAEKDAFLKRLHRMILRTPHRDEVPLDDEIMANFCELKNKILQLVKNHYPKFVEPHASLLPGASSDLPELALRSEVADLLYDSLFSPQALIFGVGGGTESALGNFELTGRKSGSNVKTEDVIEWQVRTTRLAKALNRPVRNDRAYDTAVYLYNTLGWSLLHEKCTKAEIDKVISDMKDLCIFAHELALTFRSNKTEYRWEQRVDPSTLVETDIECLGTEGPASSQPHRIARIVFGRVVRGDKTTGKLADGSTRICRSGVIIGRS